MQTHTANRIAISNHFHSKLWYTVHPIGDQFTIHEIHGGTITTLPQNFADKATATRVVEKLRDKARSYNLRIVLEK